jgi:ethanolamine transporter EutH
MKLPLTVTQVNRKSGYFYEVVVAYADGTTGTFLVPLTLATVEAVTISALAMGVLSDIVVQHATVHGPNHKRFDPRS